MDEDVQQFEAELAKRGEAAVRADLDHTNQFGDNTAKARAWLIKQEAGRQNEERQAMFASVRASNDAAQVSRQSAEASRRSAFWTMIAAIVSALGVALNAANALGWLDWAKHISH
jgi:hypothetical protein